jgi:hypothetical protein
MPRGSIWIVFVLLAACGSRAVAAPPVDCGSSTQGPGGDYDAVGRSCVWDAYSSGKAVRWSVRSYTIEGDPIPGTLRFDPSVGIEVTRDVTADNFSAPADRRMWTWRCGKMTRMTWVTDPSRYSFELTGCTGDGPSTGFPG